MLIEIKNRYNDSVLFAHDAEPNSMRITVEHAIKVRADLSNADLPAFQLVPEVGPFVGWKKLKDGIIAKVQIPAKAKRTSSLVGRKNRAEFVKVLWLSGDVKEGISKHDNKTKYVVGETVNPDSYNGTIQEECVSGIHFFITRKEAEDY